MGAIRDYRAKCSTQPPLVALWTFTSWLLTAAVAALGVATGIASLERRYTAAAQRTDSVNRESAVLVEGDVIPTCRWPRIAGANQVTL